MDFVEIAKIVALAVGVIAGIFLGYKEFKERKARAYGLLANPTRCEDHETRMRKVETICVEVGPKIVGLEKDVTEIKGDVKQLIALHLQK